MTIKETIDAALDQLIADRVELDGDYANKAATAAALSQAQHADDLAASTITSGEAKFASDYAAYTALVASLLHGGAPLPPPPPAPPSPPPLIPPAPVSNMAAYPTGGNYANLDGTASTGDGLSYKWTTTVGSVLSDTQVTAALDTPGVTGTGVVTLTVTDSGGRTDAKSMEFDADSGVVRTFRPT